jgi:hypothetical protein
MEGKFKYVFSRKPPIGQILLRPAIPYKKYYEIHLRISLWGKLWELLSIVFPPAGQKTLGFDSHTSVIHRMKC